MDSLEIRHDVAASRFIGLHEGRPAGLIDYRRDGDVLAVMRTETKPALRGQGIAADLTHAVLEHARAAGLRVQPVCPYTERFLRAHPEYDSLRV